MDIEVTLPFSGCIVVPHTNELFFVYILTSCMFSCEVPICVFSPFKNFLFIYYFWLCWVIIALCQLALVAATSRSAGLLTGWWHLLLRSVGSRVCGLQWLEAMGSGVKTQ